MIDMLSYVLTFFWWAILIVVCLSITGSITEITLPEALAAIDVAGLAESFNTSYQIAFVVLFLIVLSPALFYSWQNWIIEIVRLPFAIASMLALGVLLKELPIDIIPDLTLVVAGFLSSILASLFFAGVRGKTENISIQRAIAAHGVANAVIIAIAIIVSNASLESFGTITNAMIIWAIGYPLAWRSVAVGKMSPITRATEAIVFSSCLLFLVAYVVIKRLKRLF